MNDVQKNFKKQMAEIESNLKQEENKGYGHFTNIHYKDKFYGERSFLKYKKNSLGILVIIIIALMFFSNTTLEGYKNHLANEFNVSTIDNIPKAYAQILNLTKLKVEIKENNYKIYSIYTVYFNDTYKFKVIGVFKNFITIDNKDKILVT